MYQGKLHSNQGFKDLTKHAVFKECNTENSFFLGTK
jgi:hypothetical protein